MGQHGATWGNMGQQSGVHRIHDALDRLRKLELLSWKLFSQMSTELLLENPILTTLSFWALDFLQSSFDGKAIPVLDFGKAHRSNDASRLVPSASPIIKWPCVDIPALNFITVKNPDLPNQDLMNETRFEASNLIPRKHPFSLIHLCLWAFNRDGNWSLKRSHPPPRPFVQQPAGHGWKTWRSKCPELELTWANWNRN